MSRTVTVMSGVMRPLVEDRLPDWVEPHFFLSREEAVALAPQAEIGWFDMNDRQGMAAAMTAATQLKWLHSTYSGLDGMPLETLRARGTIVTNGAGINAITIAEYVVMGMLIIAKGYRDVVRAQGRHEWLTRSPGKAELFESKALLLGYGAIGKRIEERLKGFAVDVTVVRRTPGPGTLTPDQWRARLGDFDWVILAVPATAETDGMIGAAELAAMKPSATLINIARGTLVDQDALVAALRERRIASAFLDVTTPEPLPADHPLWSLDNAHLTMHLSGRAQDTMFVRSAERFLENLDRWHKDEAVQPQIDLTRGY
ncbi:MAG: D-2-hydroxyacid dehydrogenase [Alphaproteobacteria bacterium HGW-Alphaproteobacteria-13]|jgi:phosphoglycerate dehydrogenase-like enzyme|nr:MAG: D-2-hydroxyacid dehydrogenase [Alphaproteobacteria bacterium HGW-Alphaproteobacteria-13]